MLLSMSNENFFITNIYMNKNNYINISELQSKNIDIYGIFWKVGYGKLESDFINSLVEKQKYFITYDNFLYKLILQKKNIKIMLLLLRGEIVLNILYI